MKNLKPDLDLKHAEAQVQLHILALVVLIVTPMNANDKLILIRITANDGLTITRKNTADESLNHHIIERLPMGPREMKEMQIEFEGIAKCTRTKKPT